MDNYVDDLKVPDSMEQTVTAELEKFGLATKPSELFPKVHVFGLQLDQAENGVYWRWHGMMEQI